MGNNANVAYGSRFLRNKVKKSPTSVEDIRDEGSIPGSGRSPGCGNGNPL